MGQHAIFALRVPNGSLKHQLLIGDRFAVRKYPPLVPTHTEQLSGIPKASNPYSWTLT